MFVCVCVFFTQEINSSWYLAADASTARLLNPTKNYFASWNQIYQTNYDDYQRTKPTASFLPSSTNNRTFSLGRAVKVILVFCR